MLDHVGLTPGLSWDSAGLPLIDGEGGVVRRRLDALRASITASTASWCDSCISSAPQLPFESVRLESADTIVERLALAARAVACAEYSPLEDFLGVCELSVLSTKCI